MSNIYSSNAFYVALLPCVTFNVDDSVMDFISIQDTRKKVKSKPEKGAPYWMSELVKKVSHKCQLWNKLGISEKHN